MSVEAPVIKVSPEKYKEFFDGEIWEDLKDILSGRLEQAKLMLESKTDHVEILKLQGIISELKFFLDLDEIIMSDYQFEASKETLSLDLTQEETNGEE